MTTLTLRNVKNAPLTNQEVDDNFSNLNADKSEKSANLSDLTDAAVARSNLGVYSTAQVDAAVGARLEKSANLSDLTSASTARSNINVYSVQEAQEYATAMAIALG